MRMNKAGEEHMRMNKSGEEHMLVFQLQPDLGVQGSPGTHFWCKADAKKHEIAVWKWIEKLYK